MLARHHCIDLEHCSSRALSDTTTCGRRSVIHAFLTVPHHIQDDDGASLRPRADDPVAVARRSNVQEQLTDVNGCCDRMRTDNEALDKDLDACEDSAASRYELRDIRNPCIFELLSERNAMKRRVVYIYIYIYI